jgi:hypothetical protein
MVMTGPINPMMVASTENLPVSAKYDPAATAAQAIPSTKPKRSAALHRICRRPFIRPTMVTPAILLTGKLPNEKFSPSASKRLPAVYHAKRFLALGRESSEIELRFFAVKSSKETVIRSELRSRLSFGFSRFAEQESS